MSDIQHYEPGERVEVWRADGPWVPATIAQDAPYPKANTGGAYVYFAGGAGYGWKPQNQLRRPVP